MLNILERFHREKLLAVVLAGGRGSRLKELTNRRSKPAMPLGKNLFIDYVLSNIRNSDFIKHTYVLTQYESQGLQKHINNLNTQSGYSDRFVETIPAQKKSDSDSWYLGTAHAVYKNHSFISDDESEHVIILAADHVFKLDIVQYYAYHLETDADVTVCGRFMPLDMAAKNFGVMEFSDNMVITGFEEKPENPKEHPTRLGECFGSMGIYIFKKDVLLKMLAIDHIDKKSKHDFGGNIIPKMIRDGLRVIAYDHETNTIEGEHIGSRKKRTTYWRDVGTVDSYWETNMDLVGFDPDLDLFNQKWPVITVVDHQPCFKLMMTDDYIQDGNCPHRYMSAGGTVVTNPRCLVDVVFGRRVTVDKEAHIKQSVILDDVKIGAGARITKTIIDSNIVLPDNCIIGESIDDDKARNIRITEKGVRLVHAGSRL